MTPKEKYDEQRRVRKEKLEEQKQAAHERRQPPQDEEMENAMLRVMNAFERIADVLELWADKQVEQ